MLFIPCRGGVSHRPDEYASPEWIGSGVHVLARTLAQLAGMRPALCNRSARRCMLCLNPFGDCGFRNHEHALRQPASLALPFPARKGVDKLLGRARYVDDMEREGMWYGATVRSTIPRGLIRSITFDRRIDWSEFAIVTAADIPGENCIQLIVADQPCLADGKVNHCEEPILLLAHPDKHKLREAVGAVQHRVRSAAAPSSPSKRASGRIRSCGARTICSRAFLLEKGDVDSAWASAAHIVEGEYRTGAQEHLYIENNGMIAEYSAAGRRHGVGLAAVPVLRFQIAARRLRSA